MATIHLLKPIVSQAEAPRMAAPRKSAEIILFTGVRYERWADAGEPTAQDRGAQKQKRRRRSRAKRDTMTIVV